MFYEPNPPKPAQSAENAAIDARTDSPMREDGTALNKSSSPVNGIRLNGPATSSYDPPAAGFTAVNGDDHQRYNSFRPADPPRSATLPPVDQLHSARTRAEQPDQMNNVSDDAANKRKRAASFEDESRESNRGDHQYARSTSSPKRRMNVVDDRSRSLGPGHEDHRGGEDNDNGDSESASRGTYVRAASPVFRANGRTPPPRPRPEVEADLARQVAQFSSQGPPGRGSKTPHQEEHNERQRSQDLTPDPDQEQQNDSSDPKKRKRNFSNRTKTGCHTCRQRKKKCDEGKPECNNCIRGSFVCGGYGPKIPGGTKVMGRSAHPLQAKQQYEPSHGPATRYFGIPYQEPPPQPMHQHPSQPQPHYNERFPLPRPDQTHEPPKYPPQHIPPIDTRPHPVRESWSQPPPPPPPLLPPQRYHTEWNSPHHDHPPSHSIQPDRHQQADFSTIPLNGLHPRHQNRTEQWHPPLPPHPPPPTTQYRPPTASATAISSRESVMSSNSGSNRSGHELQYDAQAVDIRFKERHKMLRGDRYRHYFDSNLRAERRSCKSAVDAYNDVWSSKSGVTLNDNERAQLAERFFNAIQDPAVRDSRRLYNTPKGSTGHHSVVETPFNCEYGYNIHLGAEVYIDHGCTFQDANLIYIGDRSIVSMDVKFLCMTTSVDAGKRGGSQGEFQSGPIRVESDVFIGAGATIMPFRTIGKGAVVGAGSVVTKDVKPYTVVAGVPAKVIRKRRIEPGPDGDRHCDDIQEENEAMLEKLRRGDVIPRKD